MGGQKKMKDLLEMTDEELEAFLNEDDGEEPWDEETQKDWDEKMNSVKPPKKQE